MRGLKREVILEGVGDCFLPRAVCPAYEGIETRSSMACSRLGLSRMPARSAPLMRGLKPFFYHHNRDVLQARAVCPAYEGIETQRIESPGRAVHQRPARSAPLMRGLKRLF